MVRGPALVLRAALLTAALASAPPLAAQAPAVQPRASAPGGGSVRADTLWSQSLGARKQFVVYLPPSYDREPRRRYPVAYYLHGLWGDEWNWVRQGRLAATLDSLTAAGAREMIVVMPDGDDSWYTTWNQLVTLRDCERDSTRARMGITEAPASRCVPWPHYDDYIARDLVARVDSAYRTVADRRSRAIAGLSMGGYGAVSLALAYPDVFGAAASHSGVLSPLYAGPRPYAAPARFATSIDTLASTRIGRMMVPVFGRDTAGWWARDPARLAARALERRRRGGPPLPALFVDVGVSDGLVDQNRAFHAALTSLGVPHRYAEWPGAHTWDYWRLHAAESLAWLATTMAAPATR
jgi:S-formylglutathione hydrolase FrmB